jgi:hypothetical protein
MADALPIDRCDLFRGEACRKDNFKHFDVIAVAELAMTNTWGLMDT